MNTVPKYLQSHRNFNAADYAHLAAKGYTAREIAALWDKQSAPQGRPVIFDAVSYFSR